MNPLFLPPTGCSRPPGQGWRTRHPWKSWPPWSPWTSRPPRPWWGEYLSVGFFGVKQGGFGSAGTLSPLPVAELRSSDGRRLRREGWRRAAGRHAGTHGKGPPGSRDPPPKTPRTPGGHGVSSWDMGDPASLTVGTVPIFEDTPGWAGDGGGGRLVSPPAMTLLSLSPQGPMGPRGPPGPSGAPVSITPPPRLGGLWVSTLPPC